MIARRYHRDFRQLAAINGIKSPYIIRPGQFIRIAGGYQRYPQPAPSRPKIVAKTTYKPRSAIVSAPMRPAAVGKWVMPAQGRITSQFNNNALKNNGIDISGSLGSPIIATAPGRVVYSGSGLRGLGRLIIIKHNAEFLSAYANNKELLVKEGDLVKVGQKIAEMGHSSDNKPMLHFEIRRNGKPVDPLIYLR